MLFDIDGTLIDSGGAGAQALEDAFHEVLGRGHGISGISMAGRTDLSIMRESFAMLGIPFEQEAVGKVLSAYLSHLEEHLANGPVGHVKPGMKGLLDMLSGINGHCSGLLTGNVQAGAQIKLQHYGLAGYFSFGAYGDDNEERGELLPIAVSRYKALFGHEIAYRDCVVIGDTPRDVHCAKPYGAVSVGVATGPFSRAELLEAGADYAFEDFSDYESIAPVLLGN